MRAKEFIVEAAREFPDRKSDTMVATYAFPDMPSNNPYKAYRFGLAMANHEIKHEEGPADEYAIISAYSQGEEEIIKQAVKKTGNKAITIAKSGSKEPKSTNTQSPVAAPKKNRYGV
jgi:hypothetical protein